MYPLHMKSADGGHALANDDAEHRTLSEMGYEPKFEEGSDTSGGDEDELTTLRAKADAAGISYDKRWGVKRLREAVGE